MRADIVSCRNLLIYFQPELQARVIPRLHYALKQSGLLFVGKSESVAQFEGYFEQIGKGGHLFHARGLRQLPPLTSAITPRVSPGQLQLTAVERMHAEHTRLLMDAYVPPSMLVTRDGAVVHTIGDVSAFVIFPAGRPTLNVAHIMRGEYRGEVQMLLHRASRENALVSGRSHLQASGAGVVLTVRPATAVQPNTYLLAFERVEGEAKPSTGLDASAGEVVLRSELIATQENLQTVVEELETQNEEMQALNEELQSTNEEMQSANEELETANEELQSSNEELTTVNDELSRKSRDLEDANADMVALLEGLPYPVLHLDDLLSITRTNSAARRLFGLPSAHPVPLDHIALPGKLGQLREELGRVRASGEPYESQLQLGDRNFHLVVTQSRLPSRQTFGVLVQLVDVTSLAVANRELLNSQKRVVDILKSSSLLVVICDPRGQVEFINPQCAQTLAVDAQDGTGHEFWKLFEASHTADMRKQFLAALSADSVTELALSVQVGPHDKRLHTVWIPLAGTDGVRTGLCWKALDITELEQSRQKTLQSDAMNRAVLNAIPAVVSVLDATGKIVAVNEGWRDFARNNGAPGKDWIGENYLDCLGKTVHLEPGIRELRDGILDVLAGRRQSYTADYPCHGPDTQRWFQMHVVQMGEQVGGVAIMHFDITRIRLAHDHLAELKEVLEATVTTRTRDLQQAVDELEMFSFTVSHDLRTPLRGMIGFGEVLQTEHWASLNADARGCVERIVAGAHRMSRYLEELLKLSHLSRGELLSESIDVTKLVHEIAEECIKREPARRVEFTATSQLRLKGDPSLMRAVFENLIGNAWKFTRPRDPARIAIGTTMHLGKPTVFVRDNGVGFDMSYKNQLFMPFQRLHPAGTYEGSGLGLAAARRIVMRHGGTLDAEARLDLGATFYVWLPEEQ